MRIDRYSPWAWLPPAVGLASLILVYAAGANHALFLGLNHLGHALADDWWANLTLLGDGAVALALVLPTIRHSPQRFWAALIAAVIATLWVHLLKHWIELPRPPAVFPPDRFFHIGPAYQVGSFPSGHTTAIFAIAGIWIMTSIGHGVRRALLLMLAALVGLSRIMVGVHWPLDVLAGMLGGWAAAWIGVTLSARWAWKTSGIGGFLAGAALLAVAAALLVDNHIGHPDARVLQRLLGVVCFIWGMREMLLMLPMRAARANPNKE